MHERIFEIIQDINGRVGLQWDDEDKKEFAELIVQECIHALWTEECRTNAMAHADYERSGNRIHKHFYGVEE